MITVYVVQSDVEEKDVVDSSENNPTWRHALVVGEARVADHLSRPPHESPVRNTIPVMAVLNVCS
jgi:hypothetical protein